MTGGSAVAARAPKHPKHAKHVVPPAATFATGFSDGYWFQYYIPSVQADWLTRAQQIDSSWVRLWATWSAIARTRPVRPTNPNDPAYDWTTLDGPIRDAVAHHQSVEVQILWAPAWAEASTPPSTIPAGTWEPSAPALGQFARALATRYSGHFHDSTGKLLPRVSTFQIWNEPNLTTYLNPQWGRASSGAIVPLSPAIYKGLLNAGYANIKAVQPHAFVVGGGLSGYGDPPGGGRMSPAYFYRHLFCLNGEQLRRMRCPNPAHLDALDHHPYASYPTSPAGKLDDVSIVEMNKLQRILAAAVRYHNVLPAKSKPIWIEEVGWYTNPPRPDGIPLAEQAQWLSRTFYELWRQGVTHVMWLAIGDQTYQLPGKISVSSFGVYFQDGVPKPAAAAYRFPFVAVRGRRGATIWGRAPGRGTVQIEVLGSTGWKPLMKVRTRPDGVFVAHRPLAAGLQLQAALGGAQSLPWTT